MSYNKLDDAHKWLNKLKLELGVRSDNEHVGSGLGGNASELFFLMSKRVKPIVSPDDKAHFRDTHTQIIFEVPEKPVMKQVRQELTSFISSHPDKNNYTFQQITNTSFLRDQMVDTVDIKFLIKALEIAQELVPWLDSKIEVATALRKMFNTEQTALDHAFLREMGLPEDSLDKEEDDSDLDYSPEGFIHTAIKNHPIWGKKKEAVNKRYDDAEKTLLSQEDLDKMNTVGCCPQYIALLVFRTQLQIDRIVALNIDERLEVLAKINKVVDS